MAAMNEYAAAQDRDTSMVTESVHQAVSVLDRSALNQEMDAASTN